MSEESEKRLREEIERLRKELEQIKETAERERKIREYMDTILSNLDLTLAEHDLVDAIIMARTEEEAKKNLDELLKRIKERREREMERTVTVTTRAARAERRAAPTERRTPTAITRNPRFIARSYISTFKAKRGSPNFKEWWESLDAKIRSIMIEELQRTVEEAKRRGTIVTEADIQSGEFDALIDMLEANNVRSVYYYIVSEQDELLITDGMLANFRYLRDRIPQLLEIWRPAYAILIP